MKKSIFINIFFHFIGFFIIIYFIFFRILRINQFWGSNSEFVSHHIHLFILLLLTFFYFLFFFNSLFAFKKNKNFTILNNLAQNRYIKNLSYLLFNIKNSPKLFYKTFIFDKMNVSLLIEKPIFFIIKLLAKKNKTWIPLIFSTLPKVIVATSFFISIIFKNDFSYFFKSVLLLIIPLVFNVYFFMIKDLATKNFLFFESHLKFEKTTENILIVNFADKTPEYPDAIDVIAEKNNHNMLKWLVYNYDIYRNIYNFTTKIENIQEKYSLYENIYISFCYFYGWLYFWYLLMI